MLSPRPDRPCCPRTAKTQCTRHERSATTRWGGSTTRGRRFGLSLCDARCRSQCPVTPHEPLPGLTHGGDLDALDTNRTPRQGKAKQKTDDTGTSCSSRNTSDRVRHVRRDESYTPVQLSPCSNPTGAPFVTVSPSLCVRRRPVEAAGVLTHRRRPPRPSPPPAEHLGDAMMPICSSRRLCPTLAAPSLASGTISR